MSKSRSNGDVNVLIVSFHDVIAPTSTLANADLSVGRILPLRKQDI